uniref:Uncharacterized protein n=1 Tax=Arundo donax TaxID=35708 RepID=A0A0A8Y196_ARUDO
MSRAATSPQPCGHV